MFSIEIVAQHDLNIKPIFVHIQKYKCTKLINVFLNRIEDQFLIHFKISSDFFLKMFYSQKLYQKGTDNVLKRVV